MGLCYIFARMKITKSTLTNKKMKRTILLIAALLSFANIYKDNEEVAYETIFVGPGEEISCDFSDCEAGEYTIYTTIDGEMEWIDTITVK